MSSPQFAALLGFYGEFKGRAEIARMVRGFFHRDACDFSWTISHAVSDGRIGYASCEFSYVSKMAGSEGRRVNVPGMCRCELDDGLISRYSEMFERAPVLAKLGFADDRILKSVKNWAGAR